MKKLKVLTGLILFSALTAWGQNQADGIKAIEYENLLTAKRIFLQLTAGNTSDPLNYYYLGIVYSSIGKIDSARIAFNAGVQADPKMIHNYIGLGRTYLDQNNQQQAQQYFDKAKSLTTHKDLNLYIHMANAYTNSQHPDYNMSVTLLNKAIEYSNKNAEVYWELGNAYEGLGKSGDAVNAYERALELNPGYAKAHTRIGVIWRNARRGELSNESFKKATTIDPNYPPAYREEAELFHAIGQDDKAREAFEKYRSLADKDDNLEYRYGVFLFLTNKYQDALNVFNELKSRMTNPILYRLLGYSNYEVGNYAEGLRYMKLFFLESDPAKILPSDYEYLGKLELRTGNEEKAFGGISEAILRDSSKYYLEDTLATHLYKQKRYAEAGDHYMLKIAAMPKNTPFKEVASSYFQAGKAYFFGKKYKSSDSVFAKLSSLSPDWPISYLFRARNHLYIDSLDTARSKAFPYYQMFVSKAYADSNTFRKELTEAYQYLGNYNAFNRSYGASLYYFGKVMILDPNNNEVAATIKDIRDNYKQPAASSIAIAKDSAGYQIPSIINGNTINCTYDPMTLGLSVSPEGSSRYFGGKGNGSAAMASILKVGDRSLKNVTLSLSENQKREITMGADVLNRMNIVLDYASSSLLLR
jgi:tetratricopeptide (TPR) repeat protein